MLQISVVMKNYTEIFIFMNNFYLITKNGKFVWFGIKFSTAENHNFGFVNIDFELPAITVRLQGILRQDCSPFSLSDNSNKSTAYIKQLSFVESKPT